ncbi:MAG: hypothetical protein K9H64_22120 [Bacteroidales bacterium]|nr:hypothetical protein [Bacteroidales bacterium]MCF8458754.1 hypothetical protein [Bacteroidales bacterium]
MKHLKNISLAIVIMISIIGCKRETTYIDDCDCCLPCKELEHQDGLVSDVIYHSPEQYKFPCFNPNIENEFIYYYTNTTQNQAQLIKYNIATHEKKVLINDFHLIGPPKWGKNNWILLNNSFQEIWKIKNNGDSLSIVATGGCNIFPNWDSTCKNIVYVYSTNCGIPSYIISKDLKSGNSDTIYCGNGRLLTLSANDMLAKTEVYYDLYISSLSDQLLWSQITDVGKVAEKFIVALCWHPFKETLFYSRGYDGVYKINFNDSLEIKIKNACNSRFYMGISVSPDGENFLVERVKAYYKNGYGLTEDSEIYIMDIDGCNERKIVLE